MTANRQTGSQPARTAGRDQSLVEGSARRTIGRLQGGYRQDAAPAVAAVARLRREAGRDAYASPTAWGLDDLADLTDLREDELRKQQTQHEGQAPSHYTAAGGMAWRLEREEQEDRAVHLAVTLWALHQQSIRDVPMHCSGWPLGRAARLLAHGATGPSPKGATAGDGRQEPVEKASEAVRKRFVRIGTSTDFDALSGRLRQLVQLLRGSRIPLDYGRLADQLYRWQDVARQEEVRRTWGREFHLAYGIGGGDGEDAEPDPDAEQEPDHS